MGNPDEEQALAYWKQKYYKTVAELDRIDHEWADTERLLTRLTSWLATTAMGQDPRLDDLIVQIRAAIAEETTYDRLEPLVEQLAVSARTSGPGDADPERTVAATATADSIRPLLRQLLERLDVPLEFEALVDSIQCRLDKADSPCAWQSIIVEISDLANAVVERLKAQKLELEEFLVHVHNRLDGLGKLINRENEAIQERADSGHSLDEGIREGIRGMRHDVTTSIDAQQLKSAVVRRLDTMANRLHLFRTEEARRLQEARTRTEQMSCRIRELEEHCNELDVQVAIKTAEAQTDPLTRIPNRLAYEQRMANEFMRWQRSGMSLSVAIFDLDHFKQINDTYGHMAGDKALHVVAQLLIERIRSIDFIARYGGEEFIALFPGTPTDDALTVVDELRSRVAAAEFHFKQQPIEITLSAGIASFGPNDSIDDVLERADRVLRVAKSQGRNRCATETGKPEASST